MRPLSTVETDAVNRTFRGALNPKSFYAVQGDNEFPVDSSVEPSLAGNVVFLNPADYGRRNVMAHEATHIWQLRHGPVPDPPNTEDAYFYGGTKGLADSAKSGKPFSEFGPEQQAAIVGDSVGVEPSRREVGVTDWRMKLPEYQHYLNEVRANPAVPYSQDPSDAFLESAYQREQSNKRHKQDKGSRPR